jgi:alpha-glucosidase
MMMMKIKGMAERDLLCLGKYLFIIGIFLSSCRGKTEDQWSLASPEGNLITEIRMQDSGQLTYRVLLKKDRDTTEMVRLSPLGIVREDQRFDTLTFVSHEGVKTVGETYTLATGKRLQNRNHYNEFSLRFKNMKGSALDIVFRAYDDGIAFKYVFPGDDRQTLTVLNELTGFALPQGKAWMQPYDKPTAYAPAYERNYEGAMPIGTPSPGEEGWCFPAIFEISGHWLLLSESNLKENFYGSHLDANPEGGLYRVVPPLENEAFGYGNNRAASTLPWEMPWRVMIVGRQLSDIVGSNLISHLADPSIIDDLSWIRPGRASWAWWSGYLDGSNDTPEKLKKYIDFAQEMSWEYSLIDAGWDHRKGFNLEEMVRYAESKGVKLLLWYNSGGPINKVNAGPRDKMFDREIRRNEMKRIADLGIKGVKIDFFGSDKQDFMKLYHDILKDAAEFKLLVNFHGCTIPRGWSRTYPNLISYEAVKGEEGYIYHADYQEKAPLHCSILPFTRNVIGSMDYTPVAFSVQQVPHRTSYGFELALSVVFESGIQHFPDQVEVYRTLPRPVNAFLRNIPAAWDDTKLVSGYPGKDVVIARQKGKAWYVGGINAEDHEKELEVDLDFLEPGVPYEAVIITDGNDNKRFAIHTAILTDQSKEMINVLPVGGFVMEIIPVDDSSN